MFWGSVIDWEQEQGAFAPAIRRGMAFLRSHDFSGYTPGKYPVEGEDMTFLVQELVTRDVNVIKPESHRHHIDIQYLLSGVEKVGVAKRTPEQQVREDLLETKDLLYYGELKDEAELIVRPGQFTVFFPSDIHRPGCSVAEDAPIRKIVVKIPVALLNEQ